MKNRTNTVLMGHLIFIRFTESVPKASCKSLFFVPPLRRFTKELSTSLGFFIKYCILYGSTVTINILLMIFIFSFGGGRLTHCLIAPGFS